MEVGDVYQDRKGFKVEIVKVDVTGNATYVYTKPLGADDDTHQSAYGKKVFETKYKRVKE